MSLCIVYLASPRDKKFFSIPRLECLNKSIGITRQVFPNTDIIVFHEDLLITDVPEYIRLEKVDFGGYEEYHKGRTHGGGYSMMCRFFSGIMQTHLALQKYTHYLRLDDDAYFINSPNININELLKYDYIYRSTFREAHDQLGLYEFTKAFMVKRGLRFTPFDVAHAPYNNFHVSSLKLWNHPLIKDYINDLQESKLILTDEFLDANIHACIIWALLPFTDLKLFHMKSFGYRHNIHVCYPGAEGHCLVDNTPFCPPTSQMETYMPPNAVSLEPSISNPTLLRSPKFLWNRQK